MLKIPTVQIPAATPFDHAEPWMTLEDIAQPCLETIRGKRMDRVTETEAYLAVQGALRVWGDFRGYGPNDLPGVGIFVSREFRRISFYFVGAARPVREDLRAEGLDVR